MSSYSSIGREERPAGPVRPQKSVAPYNAQAEESLLGAALLTENALSILANEVEPDDFYVERNQIIADHMRVMWAAGLKVDPVTLSDELRRSGNLERVGSTQHLVTLEANCPATSNARNYASIVLDHAVRRRFIAAAAEVYTQSQDLGYGVEELFDKARRSFGTMDTPVLAGEPDENVARFLEGSEEYNWLIDGLIERGDRFIVTAGEGGGKSTLLRQIAVCAAAGIHPFRFHPTTPVKTLVVDCENSEVQVRRKLRPLAIQARAATDGAFNADNLRIRIKADGLDLMQRHDVRWLMERMEANQPGMLVIGPLYKLHGGDPIDEAPARHVSRVLDVIRQRYGCALLMEAHSPYAMADGKRIGRPYGASLWSRWPEFGYCIVTDKDTPNDSSFEPWRGPRDERDWPEYLRRGGTWPWEDAGPS